MRIEIICTGDEVLTGQDRQHQLQLHEPEARRLRTVRALGHHGGRRPRDAAERLPRGRRARRRCHRQWRPRPHGGRSLAGDRRARRRRRSRPQRGVAGADGDLFPEAQPHHAAQQPQAGDAAGRRGGPRQSRRHRLRLRARHRQGALLLHAGRAAGAAADAGGADHPAAAGAERRADRDPPQALPFLWARRIPRRQPARGPRGDGAGRQREAGLPRPLSPARDQAHRARRRQGRAAS